MSKNVEAFKTVAQGALGAMSFGAYHQYTTNKLMELNNENQNIKYELDRAAVKLILNNFQKFR